MELNYTLAMCLHFLHFAAPTVICVSQYHMVNMWMLTLISPTAVWQAQWLYPQNQQKAPTVHSETFDFFCACTMELSTRLCCGTNFPPVCSLRVIFSVIIIIIWPDVETMHWCFSFPILFSEVRATDGFHHFNKCVNQSVIEKPR